MDGGLPDGRGCAPGRLERLGDLRHRAVASAGSLRRQRATMAATPGRSRASESGSGSGALSRIGPWSRSCHGWSPRTGGGRSASRGAGHRGRRCRRRRRPRHARSCSGAMRRRAHDRAGDGETLAGLPRLRPIEQAGEAEVEDLHPAVAGAHDVLGLEVAVDDPARVSGAHHPRSGARCRARRPDRGGPTRSPRASCARRRTRTPDTIPPARRLRARAPGRRRGARWRQRPGLHAAGAHYCWRRGGRPGRAASGRRPCPAACPARGRRPPCRRDRGIG